MTGAGGSPRETRADPATPAYVILRIINLFTPVRVSPAEEDAGLDISGFGEEAYVGEAEEARSTGVGSDP